MITHAAIKCRGTVFAMPRPNRHHNVLWVIAATVGWPQLGEDTQGFLDHEGNFLDRKEALAHAHACKQEFRSQPNKHQLYSEDVW